MVAMGSTMSQDGYRFRLDDGSESAATWHAAFNVTPTIALGVNFRLRFLISRLTASADDNGGMALYESVNSGISTEISVANGTKTQSRSSIHYAHNANTTQQIGSGTYNASASNGGLIGQAVEASGLISWAQDAGGTEEFEVEYALVLFPGNFSNGDTVEYRLRFADNVFTGAYNEVPVLTIVKGGLRISGGTVTIRNNS